MRFVTRSSALFLAVLVVLTSAPAFAQTVKVSDPVGDGLQGTRLDIRTVRLANRDHAIVTEVAFARVGHGHVAVWIRARGDRRDSALVLVAYHQARGDAVELLSAGGGVLTCHGLRATWDEATDRVRARLPSGCLDNGNYGAVKVKVISEIHHGEDADLAPTDPEGHWRWTDWVSRG